MKGKLIAQKAIDFCNVSYSVRFVGCLHLVCDAVPPPEAHGRAQRRRPRLPGRGLITIEHFKNMENSHKSKCLN